jgi:hypothetical protein
VAHEAATPWLLQIHKRLNSEDAKYPALARAQPRIKERPSRTKRTISKSDVRRVDISSSTSRWSSARTIRGLARTSSAQRTSPIVQSKQAAAKPAIRNITGDYVGSACILPRRKPEKLGIRVPGSARHNEIKQGSAARNKRPCADCHPHGSSLGGPAAQASRPIGFATPTLPMPSTAARRFHLVQITLGHASITTTGRTSTPTPTTAPAASYHCKVSDRCQITLTDCLRLV